MQNLSTNLSINVGDVWCNEQGYYATVLKKQTANYSWVLINMSRLDQSNNSLVNISRVWQKLEEFNLDFPIIYQDGKYLK